MLHRARLGFRIRCDYALPRGLGFIVEVRCIIMMVAGPLSAADLFSVACQNKFGFALLGIVLGLSAPESPIESSESAVNFDGNACLLWQVGLARRAARSTMICSCATGLEAMTPPKYGLATF